MYGGANYHAESYWNQQTPRSEYYLPEGKDTEQEQLRYQSKHYPKAANPFAVRKHAPVLTQYIVTRSKRVSV